MIKRLRKIERNLMTLLSSTRDMDTYYVLKMLVGEVRIIKRSLSR